MWHKYEGRGPCEFVREHSETIYRLAPVSILGYFPLNGSKVFAGIRDESLLLQVGLPDKLNNGNGRVFFHANGYSGGPLNSYPEQKLRNVKLLKKHGRVSAADLLGASLRCVEPADRSVFESSMESYAFRFFNYEKPAAQNVEENSSALPLELASVPKSESSAFPVASSGAESLDTKVEPSEGLVSGTSELDTPYKVIYFYEGRTLKSKKLA